MNTLFLGSFGYGNLGDELCLSEALVTWGSTNNIVFSNNPSWSKRHNASLEWISKRSDLSHYHIDRAIIGGGGIGYLPGLRDFLHWVSDATSVLHIHNIEFGNLIADEGFIRDRRAIATLIRATSITVRDRWSLKNIRKFPTVSSPRLSGVPEFDLLRNEKTIAGELMSIDSERDWTASSSTLKVGVGFSNRFELHENLANAAESISKVIGSASDLWPIPLIHVRHFKNMEERDDLGFYKALTALGLGESSEFYRQSLAEEWWNMNASGAIVNAQIDECHLVLTDRKHLMIRAAARGIPVICVTTGKQQSLKYLRGAMGSDAYKLVTIIQV